MDSLYLATGWIWLVFSAHPKNDSWNQLAPSQRSNIKQLAPCQAMKSSLLGQPLTTVIPMTTATPPKTDKKRKR
jgi:hypothetical protein